jgi:hypothetical protein
MLFVLEPFFPNRGSAQGAERDPHGTFARLARLDWILLVLSLVTIAGAVAGSHGVLLFG